MVWPLPGTGADAAEPPRERLALDHDKASMAAELARQVAQFGLFALQPLFGPVGRALITRLTTARDCLPGQNSLFAVSLMVISSDWIR